MENKTEQQTWASAEVRRIAAAINATPGWHAENLAVIPTPGGSYQLQVMARHRDHPSVRLIRGMSEWQDELRTHKCERSNPHGA